MAVELGGGWKLLISFKTELEQTAQHRGLHLRGDSPTCSPPKAERLRRKEVLFQKKPVLSQYRHFRIAASPLSFLWLRNPVCLKHGVGDKED